MKSSIFRLSNCFMKLRDIKIKIELRKTMAMKTSTGKVTRVKP